MPDPLDPPVTDGRPLDGLRVIAVEQFGAGPWATMQLADLGADVVKVEDPRSGGDVGRYVPPYQSGDTSLFFESFNRSKRSILLDLRVPAARPVFEDLVRESDCVFANLRGASFRRLRLRYADLADVNPQIVCCSLSGYGTTGPRAGEGAYDHVIQAMTGWMSLTGEPDGPPLRSGVSLADFSAGYAAAAAILAGVLQARRTGRGCDCDLSLFEVALAQLNYLATWVLSAGFEPTRQQGSAHASIAPFQTYATADGWIVLAAPKQSLWEALARALDLGELLTDPRFGSFAERLANRDALTAELERRLQTDQTDHWLEVITRAGVPCAAINTVAEAFADAQAVARQVVREVRHSELGLVRHVAPGLRVSDVPFEPKSAPGLGEHTESLLRELCGYDDRQIDSLISSGALGSRTHRPRG